MGRKHVGRQGGEQGLTWVTDKELEDPDGPGERIVGAPGAAINTHRRADRDGQVRVWTQVPTIDLPGEPVDPFDRDPLTSVGEEGNDVTHGPIVAQGAQSRERGLKLGTPHPSRPQAHRAYNPPVPVLRPPTPALLFARSLHEPGVHLDDLLEIGRKVGLDVRRSTLHDWAKKGPTPRDQRTARQLLLALGWAGDEVETALSTGTAPDLHLRARSLLRLATEVEAADSPVHALELALAWIAARPALLDTTGNTALRGGPAADALEALTAAAEAHLRTAGLGPTRLRDLVRMILGSADRRFPGRAPWEEAGEILAALGAAPGSSARRAWAANGWLQDRSGTRRRFAARVVSVELAAPSGAPSEFRLPGYGRVELSWEKERGLGRWHGLGGREEPASARRHEGGVDLQIGGGPVAVIALVEPDAA